MSGPELLAAETVAATATAAETAAAAEAISAAIAAAEAEAAIIAATEAAAATTAAEAAGTNLMGAELFGGGQLDPLQAAIANAEQQATAINAAQAYADAGMIDPFEKFLQYGVDADAPGATIRSLQSGFANAPLNTVKSLPQYLGMSAGGPSTMQTLYGANLAKQMLGGSGRPQTTSASTQIRPGQQVNMTQPITSLLAPQIRRRRGISLL